MLLEAASALEREELIGVVDDRGDLWSTANDTLILDERIDVAIGHARDSLDLECVERRSYRRPFRLNNAPADARLEYALAQLLEVVVDALRDDLRRRPFHSSLLPFATMSLSTFQLSLSACFGRSASVRVADVPRDDSVMTGTPVGSRVREACLPMTRSAFWCSRSSGSAPPTSTARPRESSQRRRPGSNLASLSSRASTTDATSRCSGGCTRESRQRPTPRSMQRWTPSSRAGRRRSATDQGSPSGQRARLRPTDWL